MVQSISPKSSASYPFDIAPKSRIFDVLLVCLFCIFVAWSIKFVWGRRKLYKHSSTVPGPFSPPLIGSALFLVGNTHEILNTITYYFNTYPGLFRVWFGTRLFYGVSEPKYYEILLNHQQALKKEDLYKLAEPMAGNGLFTQSSVPKWKKHRKLIAPTFNQKILDNFVEIFTEKSEILIEVLKKHAGKGEFDLFEVISRCTLDIICDTAMGVKIQAQTLDLDFTKWTDSVMETIAVRMFNLLYHNDLIFYSLPIGREFTDLCTKMRDFTKEVIQNRKRDFSSEDYSGKKAFLDQLLEINQRECDVFTDEDLLDETVTFIIGGSDTTATTISFIFTVLGMFPDVQEKVLKEVLDVIGPHRSIEISDLPQLKYTERVIKETLRIFPVASFVVRAIEENIDLGDYIAPKGASVLFGIRSTHMNEEYWPDPFKFDPDRFLPEEVAKRHPCAFIPFSFGPRNCIGMRYAYMAMKSVIATVIREYKIHSSYKSIKEIEIKSNLVTRPTYGFKVSVQLRE